MSSIAPTASKSDKSNVLLSLLNSIDAEIAYYRQRQVSIFRETAIVLALVTWGIGHLGFEPTDLEMLWSRFLAPIACIATTRFGCNLIINFRNRIHYARDRKKEIVDEAEKSVNTKPIQISYPTCAQIEEMISERIKKEESNKQDGVLTEEQREGIKKQVNARFVDPSSNIYIKALIAIGSLIVFVNMAIAIAWFFHPVSVPSE